MRGERDGEQHAGVCFPEGEGIRDGPIPVVEEVVHGEVEDRLGLLAMIAIAAAIAIAGLSLA